MTRPTKGKTGMTRRDSLKLSGLALGGLALRGVPDPQQVKSKEPCEVGNCYPTRYRTDQYSYFEHLPPFDPSTPVDHDEMRITFMGSAVPPTARAQEMMSIFIQVGNEQGQPDSVVFDCGSGVCSNYTAMKIGWGDMSKVFLSHLHGDHMSDLSFMYQAGPQGTRKTPLFVFGPGPSGLVWQAPDGQRYGPYDDGTKVFCEMLRAMLRWQSEGFCFQSTGLASWYTPAQLQDIWGLPSLPEPVRDPRARWVGRYNDADYVDPFNDGYAVVPVELRWRNYPHGNTVAYRNRETGLKVSYFPVIHTRQGALGFKLEWNGLTTMYSSDTKPEQHSIYEANNNSGKAVDVWIHEMAVPPDVWAMKIQGASVPPDATDPTVEWTKRVQASSHTPQGAFGYLLSQIKPHHPRLAVATHFPTTDDTVACALKSVEAHVPDIGRLGEKLVWSYDLMVLRVYKNRIIQCRAMVDDHSFGSAEGTSEPLADPKYWQWDETKTQKLSNPTAQIDAQNKAYGIPPSYTDAKGNTVVNYRDDGY
jgi:ribonuclease Z